MLKIKKLLAVLVLSFFATLHGATSQQKPTQIVSNIVCAGDTTNANLLISFKNNFNSDNLRSMLGATDPKSFLMKFTAALLLVKGHANKACVKSLQCVDHGDVTQCCSNCPYLGVLWEIVRQLISALIKNNEERYKKQFGMIKMDGDIIDPIGSFFNNLFTNLEIGGYSPQAIASGKVFVKAGLAEIGAPLMTRGRWLRNELSFASKAICAQALPLLWFIDPEVVMWDKFGFTLVGGYVLARAGKAAISWYRG